MGNAYSNFNFNEIIPAKTIQFINDVHVTIGSGVVGVLYQIHQGLNRENLKIILIGTVTVATLFYLSRSKETVSVSPEKVVFITGCDSGLGYSLATHASELGLTVLAGCLNVESEGAQKLQKNRRIVTIELDITNKESIAYAVQQVELFLSVNQPCELWALVNNAGVMVFGEFEWQTDRLICQQLDVNVYGTMRVTKAFLPLLRRNEGRIVNISSHCAKNTLPGLSVYGASKTALLGWNDSLRIELGKYGISVINFIPGSFVQHSNIMAHQNDNVYEMKANMTQEQLEFYGDYFYEYNAYLSVLSGTKKVKKIENDKLYRVYEKVLLEKYPDALYIHESFRYKFYHFLFRITPWKTRDSLVNHFVQLPKWRKRPKTRAPRSVLNFLG